MLNQEFFNKIDEYLELEGELEVNENTLVEDILDIDSLAHITLISLVNDIFQVEIKTEQFSNFKTIKDIIDKIGVEKFDS